MQAYIHARMHTSIHTCIHTDIHKRTHTCPVLRELVLQRLHVTLSSWRWLGWLAGLAGGAAWLADWLAGWLAGSKLQLADVGCCWLG